ncbi:uncharacterized protein LOC142539933 [Primulina tabacum]|uniref:uncharacterized protein LOC142539933 n=1 Tax=Primulina tabacum TaxID=48773 RepID=UPI003F597F18
MAEGSSRGSLKRSFVEDDEYEKPPEKKVRFPKDEKIKQGDYVIDSVDDDVSSGKEARLAARNRAMRRTKINAELLNDESNGLVPDIRKAEVQYKGNETFVDGGISIEPFNLDKEREDGYFDEIGNYVEYIDQNEIKVLRGLRRLKGTSTDKKLKMSAETKQLFDQLAEDAAKLMDNGDYNVYEEKQESFQREAEGYEKLAAARKNGVSGDLVRGKFDDLFDMFANDDGTAVAENSASAGSASVSVRSFESGALQNDYIYDESSGYYYSSSLGHYYDPSSGYYCSAVSGKW